MTTPVDETTPSWQPQGPPTAPTEPPGSPPPWATAPGPAPVPARRTQPGLVLGVILIVVGGTLLAGQLVDVATSWPAWLVIPGIAMLAGSLFIPPRGGLGLAVPGTILAVVGLVLWVQAELGLYSSWAYAWALVAPTGPGIAMLVYGLAQRDGDLALDGLRATLVGLGLFAGFALFFEGVLGLNGLPIANLDRVLPYLAIGFGLILVVLSLFGGRRRKDRDTTA